MAYFYEHIKGLTKNGQTTKIIWTEPDADGTMKSSPIIKNEGPNVNKELGHIITSDAIGQSINKDFTFTGKVTIGNTKLQDDSVSAINIEADNLVTSEGVFFSANKARIIPLDDKNQKYNKGLLINNQDGSNAELQVQGNIYATHRMDALFVNTTSDKRAKHDIQLSQFNATDIVCNTPVYNFIYNASNEPSIGILAQDVLSLDLGEFSLVDNETATGIGRDMMHIKETKLIYILWKALQEQNKRIKELETLLNK